MPLDTSIFASGLPQPNAALPFLQPAAATSATVPIAPAAASAPSGGKLTLADATQYFVGKGLSPEQAQGVAQGLLAESGGDPTAYNAAGGNLGAYGIAQDRGPRQQQMIRLYGPTPTAQQQLDFAWYELNTSEKQALAAVRSAKTPQEAQAAWRGQFERPSGGSSGGAAGNLGAMGEEVRAAYDKAAETMHQQAAETRSMLSKISPDDPDLNKQIKEALGKSNEATDQLLDMMKKPPTPPTAMDSMAKLGSPAAIIGILAGFLGRRPAIDSFSAAAAAISAGNQGDWQQFKVAHDTWKDQMQTLIQVSELQQQRLRGILEDRNTAMNEKLAMAGEFMRASGMDQQAAMLHAQGIDAVMKSSIALSEKTQQMANQVNSKWQVALDFTHKDPQGNPTPYSYNPTTGQAMNLSHTAPYEPGGYAKTTAATSGSASLDQKTLDEMADQYLAGDKSVLSGLGYGNQGAANRAALRQTIQHRAEERGMSGTDIATALAEYQGLTSGERSLGTRTATMGMAVSEARQLIPQVLQTSARVDRTQYPTLNRLIEAAEQGTGDENVIRLGIAINSFINVYARAISPTGVPTVSDKDHARELLDKAWANGQIGVGMDQITKELEAAAKAPGVVRQEFRESAPTGVSQPQIGSLGTPPAPPAVGEVRQGYRFMGGDPADPNSWQKQ